MSCGVFCIEELKYRQYIFRFILYITELILLTFGLRGFPVLCVWGSPYINMDQLPLGIIWDERLDVAQRVFVFRKQPKGLYLQVMTVLPILCVWCRVSNFTVYQLGLCKLCKAAAFMQFDRSEADFLRVRFYYLQ